MFLLLKENIKLQNVVTLGKFASCSQKYVLNVASCYVCKDAAFVFEQVFFFSSFCWHIGKTILLPFNLDHFFKLAQRSIYVAEMQTCFAYCVKVCFLGRCWVAFESAFKIHCTFFAWFRGVVVVWICKGGWRGGKGSQAAIPKKPAIFLWKLREACRLCIARPQLLWNSQTLVSVLGLVGSVSSSHTLNSQSFHHTINTLAIAASPELYKSVYFLLFFAVPRGGVTGLPVFIPPYGNFFLSAGFKIWNEHMRVSSTLIIAPALSNSPQ